MKFYTKNNCPNCRISKDVVSIVRPDYTKFVEEINIDEDEAAKQYLIANGISAAPVLEVAPGDFITAQHDITRAIQQAVQTEQ